MNDKIKKLTVVINGFSKAFSMTGWRLGYAAGPREIIAACSKIQSHNTSNATSFVQKAAVTALAECDMDVERMRQEFERRRNAIVYRLRALPEVSCASPSGAFYVLPNVTHYLDREFGGAPIRNTYGLAYYLLKEAHVAVVPGEAFGTPAHVRISFATSMDRIEEGCRRIREALARLEEPRRLRPRALNNVVTKVAAYAETRPVVGLESRNALLEEASAHLAPDAYFEWNAAIAGIVVQLRTNSPHLADFYQENFYPAALEGDLEPHAVIYAVKDIPGREAAGLVSLETATGFAFNTAFYGQVRTLALQLAAEAAARTSGALLAHCAALDVGGNGVLIWGGPGSCRTGLLAAAMREDGVRLVSSDAVLVRLGAAEPVADLIERKLYLKAKWVGKFPEIGKLLERSKLENMVVSRDGCTVDHPERRVPARPRRRGVRRGLQERPRHARPVLARGRRAPRAPHRPAPRRAARPRPGAADGAADRRRARPPASSPPASSPARPARRSRSRTRTWPASTLPAPTCCAPSTSGCSPPPRW